MPSSATLSLLGTVVSGKGAVRVSLTGAEFGEGNGPQTWKQEWSLFGIMTPSGREVTLNSEIA